MNPVFAEFYLGFLELDVAKTSAESIAALDRCERAAQAAPDLRFSLVEEVLGIYAADPWPGPVRRVAVERQRALRKRWTTLPCLDQFRRGN